MRKRASDEQLGTVPGWRCKACDNKREYSLECCFVAREQVNRDIDENVFASWSQRRNSSSSGQGMTSVDTRNEDITPSTGRRARSDSDDDEAEVRKKNKRLRLEKENLQLEKENQQSIKENLQSIKENLQIEIEIAKLKKERSELEIGNE
jgi:hypothetical protein